MRLRPLSKFDLSSLACWSSGMILALDVSRALWAKSSRVSRTRCFGRSRVRLPDRPKKYFWTRSCCRVSLDDLHMTICGFFFRDAEYLRKCFCILADRTFSGCDCKWVDRSAKLNSSGEAIIAAHSSLGLDRSMDQSL